MNFSQQPPSKEWAALKYRGEKIAEVWFKPQGEPFALEFRIPQKSFQLPGMAHLLTVENLLRTVAISPAEVESWRPGDASHSGTDADHLELGHPLPPPPPDVTHLSICINLKPPVQTEARQQIAEPVIPPEKWQDLESRWNAILVVEAAIDTSRISMDALRAEMETASKQRLTADEKHHALNADVAIWNKAKSRVHYAMPKVREFIHRATWAKGTPERKKLEEYFKDNARPDIPLSQLDKLREQLENLLKDRQVLHAQGVSVSQECQSIAAEVRGALRTLQSNAMAKARQKKSESRAKGKFF